MFALCVLYHLVLNASTHCCSLTSLFHVCFVCLTNIGGGGSSTGMGVVCADKVDCKSYAPDICTKTTYAQWAKENCPVHCNKCGGTSGRLCCVLYLYTLASFVFTLSYLCDMFCWPMLFLCETFFVASFLSSELI